MTARASVPCGSCRKCCRHEAVILQQEDGDPAAYLTRELPNGDHVLRHKLNGECVYLRSYGCSIHERAPVMCRIFDCRDMVRRLIDRGLAVPNEGVHAAGLKRLSAVERFGHR